MFQNFVCMTQETTKATRFYQDTSAIAQFSPYNGRNISSGIFVGLEMLQVRFLLMFLILFYISTPMFSYPYELKRISFQMIMYVICVQLYNLQALYS